MELHVRPLARTIPVRPGANLLEVLREHQVPVSYSCMAGRCGTCRCKVIEGEVLDAGTGQGASARYVAPSTVPTFNAAGGGGRIIFRYTLPALAATGTNALPGFVVAGAASVLGAALLVFSRRRTRSES